jgi:hypothetical protein
MSQPSVEMQKIESVIDELHIAFAVSGRLGVSEGRQPSIIDAAEFTVDVSGLDVQVRKRGDGAWIFCRSNRGRSESAVARARCRCAPPCDSRLTLISCSHCGPDGGFSTGWESCGRLKVGRGESLRLRPPRNEPDLTAGEVERLTTRDMVEPKPHAQVAPSKRTRLELKAELRSLTNGLPPREELRV